jgi:hypothetical protein
MTLYVINSNNTTKTVTVSDLNSTNCKACPVPDCDEVQPAAESATLSILRIRPAPIVNSNGPRPATRHPHRTDRAIDGAVEAQEYTGGFFVGSILPIRLLAGAVPGTPLWFQFAAIGNDAVKAIVAAWLLRRLVGPRVRLDTLNEFFIFLGVAAVAVPALSALAAAPLRYMLGDPVWSALYRWFLGDALAQVIVTPAILYWSARAYRDRPARFGEFLISWPRSARHRRSRSS